MNYLNKFLLVALFTTQIVNAQTTRSTLLDRVKQSPEAAIILCSQLKNLNKKGISVNSKDTVKKISLEIR